MTVALVDEVIMKPYRNWRTVRFLTTTSDLTLIETPLVKPPDPVIVWPAPSTVIPLPSMTMPLLPKEKSPVSVQVFVAWSQVPMEAQSPPLDLIYLVAVAPSDWDAINRNKDRQTAMPNTMRSAAELHSLPDRGMLLP